MTDTDIAFSSIDQLGGMLRSKTVSSVELTKIYLKRLHTIGKSLNAVVTIFDDLALAEAAKADAALAAGVANLGPLTGIPYGVKDLLAATGGPTTWGAAPYKHQTFDYDATVVKRLREAGAVLVAKLAMIELAGGMGYDQADASFTGPCRNPWNRDYWTGGSSSGPGAAVASGCVAFAIGSETDGSITNPSSYCGLSGIRPTYGRVSRHGAMALCWTLDKLGPMCRYAYDANLVLAAIAGHDFDDATSSMETYEALDLPNAYASHVRVGVIRHATDKVQPEVRKNFEVALAELRSAGAIETPIEIDLPKYPYDECIGAIISGEGGAAFRDIIQDGRVQTLSDPGGRRGGYSYFAVPAVDYVDAMRLRGPMKIAFAKLFEKIDVIAAPTFATVALPIDIPFDKAYPGTNDTPLISACNLVGIPAISVPSGFGIHGLPTGIMFVAPAFEERRLVALGATYQARTHWHTRRPASAA
ncbi:MAG TPA: amidase [Candidatus Eremiobacteraceae bacterium]|nr:amidase [Candidatus Eremiobacteraceae bacterium]